MSAIEYANQKLHEAWLCLFGDRDESVKLADRVKFALAMLTPGSPAVTEVVQTLKDDDQADWATIQATRGGEPYDAEQVERAIVRLDRRIAREVAHSERHINTL